MRTRIDITYDGYVQLYDYMVMDPSLKATNVTRASYQKSKEVYDEKDARLLAFCGSHNHTSVFRHSPITLHVRCPEFVARQWWKHIVGGEYTFKDTGWNEVSGRYIQYKEFYKPRELHEQHASKKQGATSKQHDQSDAFLDRWSTAQEQIIALYNDMIAAGVAHEEARIILPMGTYTEFYWTASAQAVHHFTTLRTAHDAQGLTREYAKAVNDICTLHFGDVWAFLSAPKSEA